MDDVRIIGRAFIYNNVLWLTFSGSGIEFEAQDGFEATLKGDGLFMPGKCCTGEPAEGETEVNIDAFKPRYALFRDGELIADARLEYQSAVIADKEPGRHTYRLIKLSESNESSLGITDLKGIVTAGTDEDAEDMWNISVANVDEDTEDVRKVTGKRLKIEIIGDSITCGYGVEGSLEETFTTATENVMYAWSYLTAKQLDADYSIISKSGAGIISGYTPNGIRDTGNIITGYYEKMGCALRTLDGHTKPQDFDYDFSFNPDIILINLGTNDISYCCPDPAACAQVFSEQELADRRELFEKEYHTFVKKVRGYNEKAAIVCLLGIMGTALNSSVEKVVQRLNNEGENRIYFLDATEQLLEDGFGTDYHPTKVSQQKLTDRVCAFIKQNNYFAV